MEMMLSIFLLVMMMSPCLTSAETNNATFLLMTTTENSQEITLAVDQTLKEIENNCLKRATIDTKCNVTQALREFYDYMVTDNSVVAVIGCGCTPVTEAIAKITVLWNVPVISCTSTSLVLSDRSVYHSFYRTVPSDELLVSALATIMDYNEWRQLTVLTEEQPQFLELEYRISQMVQNSVNFSKGVHFHTDILQNYTRLEHKISHVFNYQPHIFLPLASKKAEVFILCSAYHKGRFYPNYAWILLGQHEADWWRKYYTETNCSDSEMKDVLNRSLILIPYPDRTFKNNTCIDQIEEGNLTNLYNVSAYASDAVRALAEVLETCFKSGAEMNDSCMGDNLNWNITVIGNTGVIRFNETNGDRVATSTILQQYQCKDDEKIQSIGLIQNSHRLRLIGNLTIWPDGKPPDGTPLMVLHSLSIGTTVLNFTLGGITFTSVIICLLFNIIFRERKIVKLISPRLNYVLLVGVVLMALSTLAYPSTVFALIATFCTTDRFFASLGYDLVIGVALVKTCRVYYIFKTTSHVKKPLKDWQLLLIVLLIAILEVSFAVPLLALGLVNGDVAVSRNLERMPAFNEQGVLENYFAVNCGLSIYLPAFLFVSIGYKFILHIIALVFALLSRKVKIEVLNDSRETAAIIYASTILLIITCLVIFALGETVNLLNIMWTLIIFSVSMIHLGLTFIPEMVALYKDPHGKNVFKKTAETSTIPSSACTKSSGSSLIVMTATSNDNELDILREKLSQMEKRLQQYEVAAEKK